MVECDATEMTKNSDIVFETIGYAGVVTLNKPETLNAVTDEMLTELNAQLDIWESCAQVLRVIIRAAPGRAFSAGGDIRHLYERGIAKDYDFDFFAREYRLNARIAAFPKPYIAIVDGLVMGGGVGVSFHGHVIAGDKLSFAMPEVGIGFFPDVGASYILNRASSAQAMYLALTGARIDKNEAFALGLVAGTSASDELEILVDELCHNLEIDDLLDDCATRKMPVGKIGNESDIEQVFSLSCIEDMITALHKMQENVKSSDGQRRWAQATLKSVQQKSPTSLKIAHQQMIRGRGKSVVDCMKMEFRILCRLLVGADFYEGIRAAIIDKDRQPIWQPANLADITDCEIRNYFENLGERELHIPW